MKKMNLIEGSGSPAAPPRRTSIRPTRRTSSASTRRPTARRQKPRSRQRARRSRSGRWQHPAARRHPRCDRHRDPRAQGRARHAAVARGRQDASRRASARPRAPATSSSSSPARRCAPHGELVPSVRPGIDVEITREPVGVVGMITPWNFPLAIPGWKIAPALAFGNCVVFKPADLVPGCAWALAEIISPHRAAAGRVQSGHGPRLGGRRCDRDARRTSTPSASPARCRPARRSPAARSRR